MLGRQNRAANRAIWQYGGSANMCSPFVRYSALVLADEKCRAIDKQWTFSYKFSYGYGLTIFKYRPIAKP
jgi:hypothetical protein